MDVPDSTTIGASVAAVLQKQGYSVAHTNHAVESFSRYLAKPGQAAFGCGHELYKKRADGSYSIIGCVYTGAERYSDNYAVVQLDLPCKTGCITMFTPPKSIALNDFLIRAHSQSVEDIFDSLPRQTSPVRTRVAECNQ